MTQTFLTRISSPGVLHAALIALTASALAGCATESHQSEIAREAQFAGKQQAVKGAQVTITGDVVEFGRKETGDKELFGILGSGKKQVAYSKVTLNVVDVITSQVLYTVSGAGEYELSSRELIGFGGTQGYDSTLNGKVLDLAIREAVDRLAEGLDWGSWSPARQAK